MNYEKPVVAIHDNGNVLMYITRISVPCIEIRYNNIVFEMAATNPSEVIKFSLKYFDCLLEAYDKLVITNNFGLKKISYNVSPASTSTYGDTLENSVQGNIRLNTRTHLSGLTKACLLDMPSGSNIASPSDVCKKEIKEEFSSLIENMLQIKTMRRSVTSVS